MNVNWSRLVAAVLAALQVIAAGTALADWIGQDRHAVVALTVGALQVGAAVYRGDTPPSPPAPTITTR